MSRNRLSLLRAIKKIKQSQERQISYTLQEQPKPGIFERSTILAGGVGAFIAGYYIYFSKSKIYEESNESQIALKENQKKTIEQGKQLLWKKYAQ